MPTSRTPPAPYCRRTFRSRARISALVRSAKRSPTSIAVKSRSARKSASSNGARRSRTEIFQARAAPAFARLQPIPGFAADHALNASLAPSASVPSRNEYTIAATTKIAANICIGRRDRYSPRDGSARGDDSNVAEPACLISTRFAHDILADFARAHDLQRFARRSERSPLTITPRAGVTVQKSCPIFSSRFPKSCRQRGRDDPATDRAYPLRGVGAGVAGDPIVRTRFDSRPLLDADGGTARRRRCRRSRTRHPNPGRGARRHRSGRHRHRRAGRALYRRERSRQCRGSAEAVGRLRRDGFDHHRDPGDRVRASAARNIPGQRPDGRHGRALPASRDAVGAVPGNFPDVRVGPARRRRYAHAAVDRRHHRRARDLPQLCADFRQARISRARRRRLGRGDAARDRVRRDFVFLRALDRRDGAELPMEGAVARPRSGPANPQRRQSRRDRAIVDSVRLRRLRRIHRALWRQGNRRILHRRANPGAVIPARLRILGRVRDAGGPRASARATRSFRARPDGNRPGWRLC